MTLNAIINAYLYNMRRHLNNRAEVVWYIQTVIDNGWACDSVANMGAEAAADIATA